MKPVTKNTEEMINELITSETEKLNEKLDEISSKVSDSRKEEKIEDIISKMRNKHAEIINKEKTEHKKKIKEEEKDIHSEVFCPSCTKGHIHKLENSGLTMKCNGKECGEKFFVIPENADHSCTNCGLPIKKPSNDKLIDSCPFCNGREAIPFSSGKPVIKFDFSKLSNK